MTLVRLACPGCGSDLAAPPGAVLFPCDRCHRTLEAASGRLRHVPARAVEPQRDPGGLPLLHFPCWCFDVAGDAAGAPVGLPPRVVVPAVAPTHGGAFLRLARGLSLAAAAWSPAGDAGDAGGDAPSGALPGRLGVADALALAETVALACVPGAVRERLLAAEPFPLRFARPGLVWIPCVRRASRCEILVAGLEVPDRLLDEDHAPAPAPSRPGATADVSSDVPAEITR